MTAPIGLRPLPRHRRQARRQRDARRAIPTIGAAICRSTGACGISTRSGSTIYREANGQFEAFKRGLYDFRVEPEPLRWHDGYDFAAARKGEVIRETIKTRMPQPSEFLVFNTRRPLFSDIRVRQALTLLFDFEWINRNYFFGLYGRSAGFFAGSELSAYGRARRRTRARAAEAVRRADPARYSRRQLSPARHRRLGPRPHHAAQRAAPCCRRPATNSTAPCCGSARPKRPSPSKSWSPPATRNGSRWPISRDLKRAGIEVTVRAVDPVQFDQRRLGLRIRHDPEPLGPVAVARQRAVVLLGQPGRRHHRHAQLHGREGPRDRRPDRRACWRRASGRLSSPRCGRSTGS